MLNVGSVGGAGFEIPQMLQRLARKQTEGTTPATATQTGYSQEFESRRAEFESTLVNALTAAGLDPTKLDALQSDIRSAVSTALSQADDTTDARRIAGQAINNVLQEYGVDVDKLKQQMRSVMGSMRPQGLPPGGPGGKGRGDFGGKVTEALTAAGVDASQLETVKSAIDEAVAAVQKSSDGAQGSPDAIKSAVHDVLAKYGIDSTAFDAKMEPPKGSRPGGPPPGGENADGTSSQTRSALLFSYLDGTGGSSDSYQWLAGLFSFLDEVA